jgi:hypothetical protein
MSRAFIPSVGHFKRQKLAAVFRDLLCRQDLDFDLYVTLVFNRERNLARVRRQYGQWLARLDREHLGRRWYRRDRDERTFAIAAIENLSTNVHLHALMRLPEAGRKLSYPAQAHSLRADWSELEPAGSCDVQKIYNLRGAAGYISKQLDRRGYFENCMIISSEYHNSN